MSDSAENELGTHSKPSLQRTKWLCVLGTIPYPAARWRKCSIEVQRGVGFVETGLATFLLSRLDG